MLRLIYTPAKRVLDKSNPKSKEHEAGVPVPARRSRYYFAFCPSLYSLVLLAKKCSPGSRGIRSMVVPEPGRLEPIHRIISIFFLPLNS